MPGTDVSRPPHETRRFARINVNATRDPIEELDPMEIGATPSNEERRDSVSLLHVVVEPGVDVVGPLGPIGVCARRAPPPKCLSLSRKEWPPARSLSCISAAFTGGSSTWLFRNQLL